MIRKHVFCLLMLGFITVPEASATLDSRSSTLATTGNSPTTVIETIRSAPFKPIQQHQEDLLPYKNLTGILSINTTIPITLNVRDAALFDLNAKHIQSIFKQPLSSIGLDMLKTSLNRPRVNLFIEGETTGGGGARYSVTATVTAWLTSPYQSQGGLIETVLWTKIIRVSESMIYDPRTDQLDEIKTPIKQRVQDTVQEISHYLASAFYYANEAELTKGSD